MKRLTVVPFLLIGCGPAAGPEERAEPEATEEPGILGAGCLVIASEGPASVAYDYDRLGRLIRYDDGDRVVDYTWSDDGLEVRYPFGSYAARRHYDPELGYPFAILEVKESQTPDFAHRLETRFTYEGGLLLERREDQVWPEHQSFASESFRYGPGSRLESQRREGAGRVEDSYYAYDPSGRLESADVYREDEPIDTRTFHYDDDGKPIRVESAAGAPALDLDYEGRHCRQAVASWPTGAPEALPASHPRPVVW